MKKSQKILFGSVIASSFGFTAYKTMQINKQYKENFEKNSKIRDEFFKNPNLELLYSPLTFLYLYKVDDTFESLYNFIQYVNFFKPKEITFDTTNDNFEKKYAEFVKSEYFTKDMERINKFIELKSEDQLKEFKFTPYDLMHLYSINKCYTGRCKIFFIDDNYDSKNTELIRKIDQLYEREGDFWSGVGYTRG